MYVCIRHGPITSGFPPLSYRTRLSSRNANAIRRRRQTPKHRRPLRGCQPRVGCLLPRSSPLRPSQPPKDRRQSRRGTCTTLWYVNNMIQASDSLPRPARMSTREKQGNQGLGRSQTQQQNSNKNKDGTGSAQPHTTTFARCKISGCSTEWVRGPADRSRGTSGAGWATRSTASFPSQESVSASQHKQKDIQADATALLPNCFGTGTTLVRT